MRRCNLLRRAASQACASQQCWSDEVSTLQPDNYLCKVRWGTCSYFIHIQMVQIDLSAHRHDEHT
jgi:hypothetical protein